MNVMTAWKDALMRIQAEGFTFIDDESRECHEMENFVVTISDLSDVEAPLQRIRGQGEWYYPSNEELKGVLFSLDTEEVNRYAYGKRIFDFRSQLNQLDDYVIPLLREHPESRRALIVIADPIADEVTQLRNFISMLSVWFRVIKGKLFLTAVVRSSDFLLGWPANIYQARLLQEYVADKLGLQYGAITTVSLSAHYFSEENWLLKKILG